VAVAKSGSFTKAARQLYISHSTTSRAVSALEAELGVRLLERGNHILGLTEAGEVLLPEAEKILHSIEEAKNKLSEAARNKPDV